MRDDSSIQKTQDAINSVLATFSSSSVDAFLNETLGTQPPPKATPGVTTPTTPVPAPVLADAKKDLKGLEYRDIINREIQMFRDGSVRHDLAKQKEAEDARRRLQARMKRDEEASVGAIREEDMAADDWDSEEEGRKREKWQRASAERFKEKEERFEKYQGERERKRDKEGTREKEMRDGKNVNGKKMKEMLSGFDDEESAKHEFYTDR
jgi:hypothetical protein